MVTSFECISIIEQEISKKNQNYNEEADEQKKYALIQCMQSLYEIRYQIIKKQDKEIDNFLQEQINE